MKKECQMCGKYKHSFTCPTGKHKFEAGKIHSGAAAIYDSQWECPNCNGRGYIEVSLIDRILLSIHLRMRRLRRLVYPN